MLVYAGICWFGAGLAGGPATQCRSTSLVLLVMLVYQPGLAGDAGLPA